MSHGQSESGGGQGSRAPAKTTSLWPIAITVIVVAVLLFGVYVVNRVLGALEEKKKAEMVEGVLEKVMGIEGVKVVPAGDDYRSHISFSLTPTRKQVREGEQLVVVRGTVRNDGDRAIVFLKVRFSFVNEDGETVFCDDDLLAHQYPFGSNNTPVPTHDQKSFDCDWWVPTTWDGTKIATDILEVGLEPESG